MERTPVEGTTLVLDEPIPEIAAEIAAEIDSGTDSGTGNRSGDGGHADFLHAVRALMHGGEVTSHTGIRPADEPSAVPNVAEEDLSDWLPGLRLTEDPNRPPRRSRREQRRERAFAAAIRRAASEGVPPAAGHGRADDETLGEYLARVEAPRLPRRKRRARRRTPRWLRRTARLALAGALIAGAVAVPWAAPDVPKFFADLVPGGDAVSGQVADPPVSPSTDAFVGPVGVGQQAGPYDGIRLEAAGQPREVVVPRLHVDSAVVPISGQSGSLVPPADPQVLGWWQEGKPAGAQYGSTVITGHTVHTGGGALDHLDKLVVGDSVRVRTDNGWIRYVVQRARIYPTEELARDAEKIFRLGGTGRLVLITCDDWNGEFYESNAVVFAAPVLDEPTVSQSDTAVPDAGPVDDILDPSGNMERRRGVDHREP